MTNSSDNSAAAAAIPARKPAANDAASSAPQGNDAPRAPAGSPFSGARIGLAAAQPGQPAAGAKPPAKAAPAAEKSPAASVPAIKPTPAAPASKPAAKPAAARAAPIEGIATRAVAGPARVARRHRIIVATFAFVVLLPCLLSGLYLWGIARDQYASFAAFSVRQEQGPSAADILGGLSSIAGTSSSETDILYDYIHSQELVAAVDADVDLRKVYSAPWPWDPMFAFNPSGTIEDLTAFWPSKIKVIYDSGSGLVTIRALAFDPENATRIAEVILARSSEMINALNDEAREDATRYARNELEDAIQRLTRSRQEMTAFRMRTQIVDPQADLQGQMGVLNSLQAQLAEAFISLDLMREVARDEDPRVIQAQRRIEVINNRIAEERQKFSKGGAGPGGEDYATLMAEFEALSVDRQFSEAKYRAALTSYDAAIAEAQRKSSYLAAHMHPTRAERSDFPSRWSTLGLIAFFSTVLWCIGVLVYYSVRDRR